MLNFRGKSEQAEANRTQAREAGLSLSKYLRRVATPAIDPPPPQARCQMGELPIHTRAAFGDGDAFASLADTHYGRSLDGSEPAILALAKAAI